MWHRRRRPHCPSLPPLFLPAKPIGSDVVPTRAGSIGRRTPWHPVGRSSYRARDVASRGSMNSVHDFGQFKGEARKISMVTAYDAWSARLIARSQVDAVLVGDSAAMEIGRASC